MATTAEMVRYYGYYSNVARGKRKKIDADDKIPCILEPKLTGNVADPDYPADLSRRSSKNEDGGLFLNKIHSRQDRRSAPKFPEKSYILMKSGDWQDVC